MEPPFFTIGHSSLSSMEYEIRTSRRRNTEVRLTHRWSKRDSNHRSRVKTMYLRTGFFTSPDVCWFNRKAERRMGHVMLVMFDVTEKNQR